MTTTAYERLTDRLHDLNKIVKTNGRPNQAKGQCPAHDDHNPSLSITRIEGRVLVHCHAGCPLEDVLAAIGWVKADLYDDRSGYTYSYADGVQVRRCYDKDGKKQFPQTGHTNGSATAIFRRDQVKEAVERGETIYLVEGEDDVLALESLGAVTTTARMGAGNFDKVDIFPLINADIIAIADKPVDDKDESGDKWARQVWDKLNGYAHTLRFKKAAVGKDAADHVAAGKPLHALLDDPRQFEPEPDPAAAVKERFPRLNWHELWADQTEQEYIHNPLLPARRLVAIYSAPKIGKSLLMLEMAVTLSRGTEFLGHTPDRRYRVLYVDYENDPRGDIRSRLQDMGYGPDDLDHLDYLSFPTMAALNSAQGGAELIAAVNAYGSEVVVIDTVSRAIDGEENSNDTWLAFYLHTGLQLKQLGVSMIRLDHSGKDESKGMRGGSAKAGDVDAFWLLTRLTDTKLRLECSANRMQLDSKLLKITRCSDPLRHELDGANAITTPEAKILELIRLCDNDGLDDDANRDAVREVAKRHGMKIAQSLIQDVIRRRKVNGTLPFTPSGNQSENGERTTPFTLIQEGPN
jgi:hypothetical protein